MPKRKKIPSIPDYVGGGKNPAKLTVQKSNPLKSLSETSMTLPELKILDAYLARINSHEPDKRYVRFEKGELEKLLNVTRILKKDLDTRINNLFQVITIQDETKRNGFTKIALFVKAECWQDEDGLWQINLACSEEAMEYIFNIENLGYLKYRLKNVVNLTSRYSYILYLYLEDNRYRTTLEVPLDELKKMLNCTGESYEQFKVFNDRVLKLCQKEINEKTTLRFTYTPIKKGRKVVAVSFDIEKLPKIETVETVPAPTEPDAQAPEECPEEDLPFGVPEQTEPEPPQEYDFDEEEDEEPQYSNDTISFLADACNSEFTEMQMNEICAIITNMPFIEFEYKDAGAIPDNIWFARYHYLKEVYTRLNVYAETHEVRRRYSLFRKFILSDREEKRK